MGHSAPGRQKTAFQQATKDTGFLVCIYVLAFSVEPEEREYQRGKE